MITYIQNSNTVVIVLHEIYGINEHIVNVCQKISESGFDVIAPNLLQGREKFSYEQEASAYRYFMENIGFESAFSQVKALLNQLRDKYQRVYVLGYSAGGTIAWRCSETGLCDFVIGFYGSRIRDYLTIEAKCPVLLFFPSEEKSFDVDCLISRLSGLRQIRVEKLAGQHGFADPFSPNYHQESTMKAWTEIAAYRIFLAQSNSLTALGK